MDVMLFVFAFVSAAAELCLSYFASIESNKGSGGQCGNQFHIYFIFQRQCNFIGHKRFISKYIDIKFI